MQPDHKKISDLSFGIFYKIITHQKCPVMKQKYKGTVCHRLEETKEKQLNAIGILEQNINIWGVAGGGWNGESLIKFVI